MTDSKVKSLISHIVHHLEKNLPKDAKDKAEVIEKSLDKEEYLHKNGQ